MNNEEGNYSDILSQVTASAEDNNELLQTASVALSDDTTTKT